MVGDRVLAASYRTSEHWITNAARGAVSVTCEITPEIEEIALRACQAVGARLAGVDVVETKDGKIVEVNTGGEFKEQCRRPMSISLPRSSTKLFISRRARWLASEAT